MPQPRKRKRVTLGDRMDALARSVELLVRMHVDAEKRVSDTDKHVNEVAANVDRLAAIVRPIAQLVLEHEERLKKLEK